MNKPNNDSGASILDRRQDYSILIYHSAAPDLGFEYWEAPKGYEIKSIQRTYHESGQVDVSALMKRKNDDR